MWTKIVAVVSFFTLSSIAFAQPNYAKITSILYPNSQEDQAFTSKFFEIVEAHKSADPLLEGMGPSISEYSLDKIKIAFMTNVKETTVDLVFFNWKLPVFEGLHVDKALSDLYGSNIYVMKNVKRKSIASQGKDQSELTNFSYMLGANKMEKSLLLGAPEGYHVPNEILDWKPNPEYMDRSAPLRQALDANTLVILSPSRELFFASSSSEARAFMESSIAKSGGFQSVVMGLMVHEIFHVKEGEDQVNRFASRRRIEEDRKEIIRQIQKDARLRSLMATYVRIVFSLGDSLKGKVIRSVELQQLADLKTIITELKTKYAETWKFIWDYEYTEGFAEYVSAYSMIQVGITSFDQKIDLEKADPSNNFAYRTGAIGGLYLSRRLQQMPFANKEDHKESVWEIILRLKNTDSSSISPDGLVAKYQHAQNIDQEIEIKMVIDYLVSTASLE